MIGGFSVGTNCIYLKVEVHLVFFLYWFVDASLFVWFYVSFCSQTNTRRRDVLHHYIYIIWLFLLWTCTFDWYECFWLNDVLEMVECCVDGFDWSGSGGTWLVQQPAEDVLWWNCNELMLAEWVCPQHDDTPWCFTTYVKELHGTFKYHWKSNLMFWGNCTLML